MDADLSFSAALLARWWVIQSMANGVGYGATHLRCVLWELGFGVIDTHMACKGRWEMNI